MFLNTENNKYYIEALMTDKYNNQFEETRILEQSYIIQLTKENKLILDFRKKLYNDLEETYISTLSKNELQQQKISILDSENVELLKNIEAIERKNNLNMDITKKEIEKYKTDFLNSENQNNILSKTIDELKAEIKTLKDQENDKLNSLKTEEKELIKELKLKNKQIKQLETKNEQITNENIQITENIKKIAAEQQKSKQEIEEYKLITKETQNELKETHTKLSTLTKNHNYREKQIEKDFEVAKEKIILEYEEKLAVAENEISKIKSTKDDFSIKKIDFENEKRKLQRNFENKLAKEKNESNNKMKELVSKIDELEYDLYTKKDLLLVNEEKENENEQLRMDLKELKKSNFDTQKLNEKYKKDLAKLQMKIRNSESQSKLDNSNNEMIEKYKDENELLKAKIVEIRNETHEKIKDLEFKNKKFTKEHESKKFEEIKNSNKYDKKIQKYKSEKEKLQELLKKKEVEINKLNDEIKEQNKVNHSADKEISKTYENLIKELKVKTDNLQNKIIAMENDEHRKVVEKNNTTIIDLKKDDGKTYNKNKCVDLDEQKSETDGAFSDMSHILANSHHLNEDVKNEDIKSINSSNISMKGKRKNRSRITFKGSQPKKAKKESKIAVKSAKLPKKNKEKEQKEIVEMLLSDNNFTNNPIKIGGLFDDLTFTEDSSIFGKKQK